MLHGNGVIMAHAPGTDFPLSIDLPEELVCSLKVAGNANLVAGVRRHAHQSADVDVCIRTPGATFHVRQQFVRAEAVLCLFLCDMYLHEDGNRASATSCLLVYLVQQVIAVNGMDETDERRDILYFIRLQVPNEMPLNVLWQFFMLLDEFLDMALAEDALTAFVGLTNERGRVVLADGYKADTFGQRLLDIIYYLRRALHLP